MKNKSRWLLPLVLLTCTISLAQNGHDLLQKALRKEHVEGDPKAAIQLYRQIIEEHGANRALAAQALLQLGKSYEHLGAMEARTAYEKLLSEYADQRKEAAEARSRLDTLLRAAQPGERKAELIIEKITPSKTEDWDHWVTFGDTRPSPDGRYFGYVNWSHGNLAVCDVETGEVRDLTSEGTWVGKSQFTWGAVWSPDSKRIAYLWVKGDEGDLRIVDRAGGKPRVLVAQENGGSIAPSEWSRDGRFIVGLAPIKKWPDPSRKKLNIVRVDAETGSVSVIKELTVSSKNIGISLSPDGRYIAYDTKPRWNDAANSSPSRIHLVSVDGSIDRPLLDHPAAHSSPHWTPDGGHLLFYSKRSGSDGLWLIPMKNGEPAGEAKVLRDNFDGSTLLGFANDGSFYFSSVTPRVNVFVAAVDFDAGTMESARLVSLRHDGKNRNVRWSADGSQLGYVSVRSADWPPSGALVIHDLASGEERETAVSALNFFSSPHWSPDLTRLAGPAKVPGRGDNARALYLVDAKNGKRSMFIDRDISCPNYTRDGRYLIYLHHDWKGAESASQVIERDLQSESERVVVRSKEYFGFNDGLVLSPDGTTLAHFHKPYSPTEEHETTLFVTARDSGKMRTVWQVDRGEASVLDWLPDNRRLLVSVTDQKGTQQLHLVDVTSNEARPFGSVLRGEERLQQVSVHPDGKRIAFSRGGLLKALWTMRNIVPEQKRAAN